MSYGRDDIRSALPSAPRASVPRDIAAADHVSLAGHAEAPLREGVRLAYARGQNFVVGYGELPERVVMEVDEADENVVILPDATRIRATAGRDELTSDGGVLVVLPPGRSRLELSGGGRVVRLVRATSRAVELARNADSYVAPHPNVAAYAPWPEPRDGFRVRAYRLDAPTLPGSKFRLYRTQHFMVSYFDPAVGPRDPRALSPHHHDDFEQCSLALRGRYVHHLRWPWSNDSTTWRPDEHTTVEAPSATIIPPPVIHTSQSLGDGENHLIDIFSPPRADFSAMDGWVLNADDYPLPPTPADA